MTTSDKLWSGARLFDHYCENSPKVFSIIGQAIDRRTFLPLSAESLLASRDIASAHVLVADDAYHYLRMKIDAEGGSIDVNKVLPPVAVPPFDHCFVEAKPFPVPGKKASYSFVGMHCIRIDLRAIGDSDKLSMRDAFVALGQHTHFDQARWLLLCLAVGEWTAEKAREFGFGQSGFAKALPAGFVITTIGPSGGFTRGPGGRLFLRFDTTSDLTSDPATQAGHRQEVLDVVCSMFYCLGFVNAKNVKLNAVEPPAKLNKARERKGNLPFVSYSVVDIGPTVQRLREAERAGVPFEQRMHFVRGHFKNYSDEKPLMGKHTGQYWWEAHVRGHADKGLVAHDYRIAVEKGPAK